MLNLLLLINTNIPRLYLFSFSFFFPLRSDNLKMSAAQEIASILAGAASKSDKEVTECIKLAKCEVEKLIKASGQTLKSVCAEIEDASTKEALAAAFRKLNSFTRIFVDMALVGKHGVRIWDALLSLQVSERLEAILRTAVSVHEALLGYKKAVVE